MIMIQCRHDENVRAEAERQKKANAEFENMDLGCDNGDQPKATSKRKRRDQSYSPPRSSARSMHRRAEVPPLYIFLRCEHSELDGTHYNSSKLLNVK